MEIFKTLETTRHEQVVFAYLHDAGLKAIIAIHDTTLGPALGGLRMWPYATEDDALEDVLRLARGMTYKAAASGLNLGGGKAVIIGDPKRDKSEMLFRSFGKVVESLGGRYITAEDVGTDPMDMEYISRETDFVTGVDIIRGGSGDPSPFTAAGVIEGMRACAERIFGVADLSGRSVAVQGLGHVGSSLVDLLISQGARVIVSDIDPDRIAAVKNKHPEVEVTSPEEILAVECDILAPCALGGVINDETLERFRTKIIAGAANNQRKTPEHGAMVERRGILYAPDFVINAGGLMNVYLELEGYSRDRALRLVRSIFHNTRRIFRLADSEGITASEAADKMAVHRMRELGRLSTCFNRFSRPRRKPPASVQELVSEATQLKL